MTHDAHFRALERAYHAARINEYFRPVLTVSEGEATVAIEVRSEFFHAADAAHGSVLFKALDDAAFFAAASLVEDVWVLTAHFELDFLAPVTGGRIVALGRVVERGERKLRASAELVLDGADGGDVVARGEGVLVKSRYALAPENGYVLD